MVTIFAPSSFHFDEPTARNNSFVCGHWHCKTFNSIILKLSAMTKQTHSKDEIKKAKQRAGKGKLYSLKFHSLKQLASISFIYNR